METRSSSLNAAEVEAPREEVAGGGGEDAAAMAKDDASAEVASPPPSPPALAALDPRRYPPPLAALDSDRWSIDLEEHEAHPSQSNPSALRKPSESLVAVFAVVYPMSLGLMEGVTQNTVKALTAMGPAEVRPPIAPRRLPPGCAAQGL